MKFKNLTDKILEASKSSIVREVAVTYSGQIVASGIGFVIQLLLQKTLGPGDYGVLALAVSVGTLTGVLTDAGISHAMVRFGSKYLAEEPHLASSRFCAALLLRLSLTGIVSLCGLLSASWFADTLFQKPQLQTPLVWVYLGLVGSTLYSYWQFYIQTHQLFKVRSIVAVLLSVARFGGFATIWYLGFVSPTVMIVVDASINLLGFFLGMYMSPRGIFNVKRDEVRDALGEIVPYARFTGILIVGDVIFNELDTFMLGVYSTEHVVGLYRAAYTYAMVLGFLNMSVSNVLFPKVAAISGVKELRSFMRKVVMFTGVLAVATIPALPIVAWWVPWYEPVYSDATPVFFIMYLGLIFELVFGPLQYVLYSLNRPGILALTAIFKIGINGCGNLLLIPLYGAYGAAAATVITRVIGGVLAVWVIFKTMKSVEASGVG